MKPRNSHKVHVTNNTGRVGANIRSVSQRSTHRRSTSSRRRTSGFSRYIQQWALTQEAQVPDSVHKLLLLCDKVEDSNINGDFIDQLDRTIEATIAHLHGPQSATSMLSECLFDCLTGNESIPLALQAWTPVCHRIMCTRPDGNTVPLLQFVALMRELSGSLFDATRSSRGGTLLCGLLTLCFSYGNLITDILLAVSYAEMFGVGSWQFLATTAIPLCMLVSHGVFSVALRKSPYHIVLSLLGFTTLMTTYGSIVGAFHSSLAACMQAESFMNCEL